MKTLSVPDDDDDHRGVARKSSRSVDRFSADGALARHQARVPELSGNGMPLSPGKLRAGHLADFARQYPGVHEKVTRKAGEWTEWSAWPHRGDDPRPKVTLLGSKALSIATPDPDNPRRWSVNAYAIDPSSHVVVRLDHDPARASHTSREPFADSAPGLTPGDIPGLPPAATLEIGNLPRAAQRFLLTPFLRGSRVEDWDYYYEGHDDRIDVFFLVLVGGRTITAVSGSNSKARGRGEPSWKLEGHRYTTITTRPGIAGRRGRDVGFRRPPM